MSGPKPSSMRHRPANVGRMAHFNDVSDMSEMVSGKSTVEPLFFDRLEINAMPAATAKSVAQKAKRHHWVH